MCEKKIANLNRHEANGKARKRGTYSLFPAPCSLLPVTCYLVLATCYLFPVSAVSAQEKPRQDIFTASFGEAVGYGYNGLAYGGGLVIGAGTGGALGLRILYAQDNESISFLEVNVLARLYVFGRDAFSGPFVQLNAGPVIYMDFNPDRSGYGNISAGLSAGWRFITGKRFFIEPALRIGYPYLAGGSVAVGFR